MVIMNFTTITLVSADDEINFASESNLAYQKSVVVQSGNKASAYPPENFTDGNIGSTIYFNPANKGHNVRVLVNLGDVYDLRIFCEISEEEQCQRIRKRNGEVMWNRFVEEWIPKENAYFKKYKIREKSGLVC